MGGKPMANIPLNTLLNSSANEADIEEVRQLLSQGAYSTELEETRQLSTNFSKELLKAQSAYVHEEHDNIKTHDNNHNNHLIGGRRGVGISKPSGLGRRWQRGKRRISSGRSIQTKNQT